MRKTVMFEITVRQSASDDEIKLAITTALIASENTLVPDTLTITDAAQVKAHGWLPIATARKDGRHILLAIKTPVGEIFVGCWSAHFEQWFTVSESGGGVINHRHKPTHWMELPEPPEAAPGKPNKTEQRLYDITFLYHKQRGHNQYFERCEHEECIQTRDVLNFRTNWTWYDKAYLEATPVAAEDK